MVLSHSPRRASTHVGDILIKKSQYFNGEERNATTVIITSPETRGVTQPSSCTARLEPRGLCHGLFSILFCYCHHRAVAATALLSPQSYCSEDCCRCRAVATVQFLSLYPLLKAFIGILLPQLQLLISPYKTEYYQLSLG